MPASPSRLPLLAVLLASCVGRIEAAPPNQREGQGPVDAPAGGGTASEAEDLPPGSLASCAAPEAVGASVLRRLSNVELQLTLQDLFHLPKPPSVEGLPADNDKDGFKTFSEVQVMSAQHLRAYLSLAGALSDALLADEPRRHAVLGCEPGQASCLRAFAERFGRLCFRRSLEASELDELTRRASEDALSVDDRFRYLIQQLLGSANFLYRVESGDQPEGLSTLTPSELATRLSFALWGRGPSAALLDDAESGKLTSPTGLRDTALRMLEDPRAQVFYRGFFRQWLGYDALRAPTSAPADFSSALLADMQRETDAVLNEHAFTSGHLLTALTSNETTLSAPLASYYGLPAPGPDGRVVIPDAHVRANAGIIGHASLLSVKSDGDMIALRGNWVRRTFFCSSLHIPPEVAADLGDLLVGLTRVEIVEKRNSEASCKGCHALIDPIGVGLSAFDATGRWDKEAAADVAAYGIAPALPDVAEPSFDSLAELAAKLRDAPEVASCLTEKVFVYMNGRSPTRGDDCAVTPATSAFEDEEHDFRALLRGLVQSPAFRQRRAPAVEEGK